MKHLLAKINFTEDEDYVKMSDCKKGNFRLFFQLFK